MAPESAFKLPEASEPSGVDRRDFLKTILMAAAAMGLPATAAAKIAERVASGVKPSVIWLHFQECTGCTESLLRASSPDLAELILQLISLDYHETLFAAAGNQAEDALHAAMEQNSGKYICVVEGSIPTKEMGIYCKVGGRTATEILSEVAGKAGAVIALGSCASWGGVQSSGPNPTGAIGAPEFLAGKPVVSIPGCPANPYNFLGVVLQYVTFGKLPALDNLGRPMFAYGRVIHTDCPRRSHYDTGRFAEKFGDANHRQGYCLYKLGCKGPVTNSNCSIQQFCDVGAWPVGIGHPCAGCTEKNVGFTVPMFQTADIPRPRPSWLFPPVNAGQNTLSPVATGVGGLLIGAGATAAALLSKKIAEQSEQEQNQPKHDQEG